MLDTIPELGTVKLEPFDFPYECLKCGGISFRIPFWLARWKRRTPTMFNVGYCPGNRDPEQSISMFGGFGEVKAVCVCAGIHAPHMHVVCKCCGYSYLMKTADAK